MQTPDTPLRSRVTDSGSNAPIFSLTWRLNLTAGDQELWADAGRCEHTAFCHPGEVRSFLATVDSFLFETSIAYPVLYTLRSHFLGKRRRPPLAGVNGKEAVEVKFDYEIVTQLGDVPFPQRGVLENPIDARSPKLRGQLALAEYDYRGVFNLGKASIRRHSKKLLEGFPEGPAKKAAFDLIRQQESALLERGSLPSDWLPNAIPEIEVSHSQFGF